MTTSDAGFYFSRMDGERFMPSKHVGGAWDEADLHVSPVVGLVVHHVEGWRREQNLGAKVLGRLSLDILGRLERGEIELQSRLLRPGRTIELIETTVTIAGRLTLLARTWFMSENDSAGVAGAEWSPMPGPGSAQPFEITDIWSGGYIQSVEARKIGEPRAGRAQAWIRSKVELIESEQASELARFAALVDTANGVAVRESPDRWMYPNLDLTIHLFRQPRGEWIGFDTTVSFGENGQGLTASVLHDEHGAVGTAQQILTVRGIA